MTSREFRDEGVGTADGDGPGGTLFDPIHHGLDADFRLTKHFDLKG